MRDNFLFEKVNTEIQSRRDTAVELLSALIAIPSVKGEAEPGKPFGKANAEVLKLMLSTASDAGFTVSNCDNYMGSIDYNEKEPLLGVLCHLDLVAAGTGWSTDPFTAYVKDGKLYGRGASDDKGPAVSVFLALCALRACGIRLASGVRFIVGCDEECGSSDLAYYSKKETLPAMLFSPDAEYPVINAEKGMLRAVLSPGTATGRYIRSFHSGATVNIVPELAYAVTAGIPLQALETAVPAYPGVNFVFDAVGDGIKITARGKSAHASTPQEGANALTALASLLTDAVQSAGIADCPEISAYKAVRAAFPYGDCNGQGAGIACEDKLSGKLTALLSVLDCEGDNSTGKVDIRFPVDRTVKQISDALAEGLTHAGITDFEFHGTEPHFVDPESPLVRKLIKAYEAETELPGRAFAIGGGTYVHNTPGGVAFGAEFPGVNYRIHGADEWTSVDALLTNAKIFARAIIEICGIGE